MPNLIIDGRAVSVPAGTTIVEAARKAGVAIPTLCYLKDVSNVGSCRVCVVEVEGTPELVAACKTPVIEAMRVRTDTPRVIEARRLALDLVISNHGLNSTNFCFSCLKNGDCELQDLCRDLGVDRKSVV